MLREQTLNAASELQKRNYNRSSTFPPPLTQLIRRGNQNPGSGLYSSTPTPEPPPPPPPGGITQDSSGGPPPAQQWDVLIYRPINFHILEDTSGGVPGIEYRTFGPIANPFRIKKMAVYCPSGGAEGQFIDVLISSDFNTMPSAQPTGTSIFSTVNNPLQMPVPDGLGGMPVPSTWWELDNLFLVSQTQQSIKVVSYINAPAVTRAAVHVTLIIEELTPAGGVLTGTTAPPPSGGPGIQPGPTPSPTPQPTPTPTPAPGNWIVQQDFRVGALIYVIASPDPTWKTGDEFLWTAAPTIPSFWNSYLAGKVTFIQPPITATNPPYSGPTATPP